MAKSAYLSGLLLIPALCVCHLLLGFVLSREAEKAGREELKAVAMPLASSVLSSPQQRLVAMYSAEVGVRERSGRNDGARVEEYLRYTGLGKGYPWCAAFVCWALGKAGIPNPRSAYSPALFPDSKIIWRRPVPGRRPSRPTVTPVQGDVFGLYFPEKGRIAHAGFVDKWEDNFVITVEGNTNEAGSREGDGVYRKRRLKGTVYRVARWR